MTGSPRRLLDRFAFVGLFGAVIAYGLVRSLDVLTFRLDLVVVVLVVVVLQAVLSQVVFSGFISVSSALLAGKVLWSSRGGPPTPTDEPVDAIVPVYRDANVLDVSVGHLLDSTQPVRVTVVVEPDDAPSLRRARELAAAHGAVECLVNTRSPGSKAGAVNYAAEVTDSEYLAVFDADEAVDPDFLAGAVAELGEYDVVQGRTVPRATGLVESLAYYESVLLSYAGRRLLSLFTGFQMAASRAVVMRRSAFERVGGYDTGALTEDYRFAHQCYRNRLAVRELLAHPSRIEAAHTLRDWWGQRKRWMTGYAQVLRLQTRAAVPPRDRRDLFSVAICAGSVVGSLLLVSVLVKFTVFALAVDAPFSALPVVAVVASAGTLRVADRLTGAVERVGWVWVLAPLVFPLYGLAATKALVEYAFSWSGEWYHAEKRADEGV
ncbi:glycosyltransferase family 2 protein [Halorussus salilacus]|uniref:glycosyltransferase n=1 Tax=Halorussus salilacus TaxID=2953750 RepID=UPI00209E2BB9|nr:glycosyltransferase [Halorussus salilacus]USZ67362.1 glycosyltransferase family 2 protein [Halorussus salilacus]